MYIYTSKSLPVLYFPHRKPVNFKRPIPNKTSAVKYSTALIK